MKTKDQLYQRESARPRVVLRKNSQSSQDLPEQEARSSWESQQDAESYGETRSNTGTILYMSQKAGDQRAQRGITKITRRHEQHRDLRILREFCKTSMS